MISETLERVGVPDDDGDGYMRVGIGEAEVHANNGVAPPEGPYGNLHELYANPTKFATDDSSPEETVYRGRELKLVDTDPPVTPYLRERQVKQAEARALGGLSLAQRRFIR